MCLRVTSTGWNGFLNCCVKVKIVLFGEMDDEELTNMFKSRCTKIGLEKNEIVSYRPESVWDKSCTLNCLTAHQQQSYFTKEMESLKQQIGEAGESAEQIANKYLMMEEQIREWTSAAERNCTDVKKTNGHDYSNSRDIESISKCAESHLLANIDYSHEYMNLSVHGHNSKFDYLFRTSEYFPLQIHREDKIDDFTAQSRSSKQKAYGEPPVFTNDFFSTRYLELVLTDQVFDVDSGTLNESFTFSETSANELCNVNRGGQKMIPCPPWQQFVYRIRGKFIYETGRLEKLKEHEPSNTDYCDFLEKEILKRNRRMNIFGEIHTKHVQKLKKLPIAATLITELMNHEIERFAQGLPIYDIRKDIRNILCNQGRVLFIVADTGSGKSTQIPQYIVFDGIITASQKVLCCQPRKTAVWELAIRVAKETSLNNHCLVNVPIYKDGMRPNLNGKINFITEKYLLDCIQQDHKLSQFGCVIIDEVHERTALTDMCLGMMKKVLRLRPDMKLVISSATMDPEPLLKYFAEFQAQKLEVSGRQYPIKICYEPPVSGCKGIKSLMWDYINRTVEKVINICESEAKKQPFDDTSSEDSLETHAAHIMAFLSNPLETLIAEERLSRRLTELNHSVKVKIMTLYGNMPVEDQIEVFAPLKSEYHHKVIFATNIGETSITIPGVRYIIDCGLAKVKKFDVARRKNVLELGLISKSAAKQRAGRAGRTAPGVCYRLYSEEQYEEMEPTNVPDILLTNLTEVLLYMIAAGITPSEFDFIEKPDSSILMHSMALLRSLKAIECCGTTVVLTQLGKKMKQLPVEPRLAKMVLDSVQYDAVAEAAVVCACIHVGSLFLRGNKRNEFVLADQKKLSFCEDSGDPMTFLAGVNANIKKIDISKARAIIPNLFCRSFGNNLAIYSGLPERGYYDFNEKKYVFIHPSSALKYGDITPEFIVYECSVHTSNDFILNVCAADSSWLDEIDKNVLEEERKNKLVPYNIRCGTVTKRWIMTHKDILQQEIGMECIVRKTLDDPYNRLQIYVSIRNLPKLKAFVERITKEKVDILCRKTREVPIMHADYVLRMSGSGTPVEILMPGEFCSMYVGRSVTNWADDVAYRMRLEQYFSKFGKITEFVTFDEEYQKKTGHSCLISMENKEVAKRAFIYNNENRCDFNIEPRFVQKYLDKGGSYIPSAYRLLIRWWRRPSYGYGHIKLKSRDFGQRLYAFNVIAKHFEHFRPSLLSEDFMIKLQSLPLNIDNKQLLHILKPVLDAYSIEFDEVFVVRKKRYPVEDKKALEEHSRRISDYIIRVAKDTIGGNGYPFEVKIRAPKHIGEIEFMAFVLFYDMNLGIHVGNALKDAAENGIILEMGSEYHMHEAHVQEMFRYQMKVSIILFNAIFNDLKNIYDRIDHEHIDFDSVNEVKGTIDKVIDGCTIKCRDGERVDGVELPCHRLLTKVGRDFLRDLQSKNAVFINISPYKTEVKIQGSVSNVDKTKMEIKCFLREWLDADVRQILILQTPNYQPGTLKALLAQNNYDLCSLEKKFGHGVHLDANIVRRELLFVGKEAQFQELLKMLHSISDSTQSRESSETIFNEVGVPQCVICLCPADLENYCLEACGHYACKSCLNMQLKASFEMRNFPIACAFCEKPLTWLDLEILVLGDLNRNKDDDPQRLQSLSDASLAYFIERHGDLYKHCLTPDCRGLHPVTTDAGLGQCRLCGRIQCTKCGREEHESMTCEEYARLRVNADESVRKWIRQLPTHQFREDQKGRRICPNPNCQSVIEKFGGCNHMQCLRCKQHFCWICMFSAEESSQIYAHMDEAHGGSGADVNELIEGMENDPFIREFIERQHPLLLDPRFNFDEEAEFWVMPNDDAAHVLMMDDVEIHNFFEFHRELNELLIDEMGEPIIDFEDESDFEDNEDGDANIM
ncbi:unnamed protein product [Acanthocheilonema viteae]|uniref:RBR-type E3 ubiquitin transferase n=1 Tax=Acanthocheilonema viteae TaxID=6277 RepID=A0A498SPT4_ACAVI|nr:unnamed protein product [Acanthocheilonema viteae]